MKPIAINYAYNGFLYTPLFLADKLGLFPKNMQLVDRGGDIPTIEALARKTGKYNNWFAICDPFARDIIGIQVALGKLDSVYIVGAFINRLPVWLYNNNPEFDSVSKEEDLIIKRTEIDEMRCYEKFNTGYLIGERLRSDRFLHLAKSKLKEVRFGEEFNPPISEKTLIITSNILRIVEEIDKKNIVFNYPGKCEELNPFLFTGILTLKSVIDNHLYSVLSVLAGLRTAIEILNSDSIPEEHLQYIIDINSAELGNLPQEQKRKRILDALYVLKEEEIYSKDFDLDDAAKAYDKAKDEWTKLLKSHSLKANFQPIERVNDPIPALLIKRNWRNDVGLMKTFCKHLGLSTVIEKEPVSIWKIGETILKNLAFIAAFLIFVYSMFKTMSNLPQSFSMKGENGDLFAYLVLFFVQIVLLIFMFIYLIRPKVFSESKLTYWVFFTIITMIWGFQLDLRPQSSNVVPNNNHSTNEHKR